jgi:hypothetical protein
LGWTGRLAPVRVSFPFATTLVRFLLGGIHFVNLRDLLFFIPFFFFCQSKTKNGQPINKSIKRISANQRREKKKDMARFCVWAVVGYYTQSGSIWERCQLRPAIHLTAGARVCLVVVCINIYYTSIAKKSDYTLLIYTGKSSSLPPFWLPINQINSPTSPNNIERTNKKVIINAGIPLVDESTSFYSTPYRFDILVSNNHHRPTCFLRVCVSYLTLRPPTHTHVIRQPKVLLIQNPDIRLNVIYQFPSLRWVEEKMESVRVILLLLLLLGGPSIRVESSASADL